MQTKHEDATKVNFQVAHLLTNQEKSLTDGELIKLCLVATTKEMCLGKINLFITNRLW
jgi:hypothetical protein